jgi:hypothetical protein
MDPSANPLVIPFLGADLRALGRQAAGAQQATDMVGVVDDVKALTDQVSNPPTGPQGGGESAGLRPFQNPSYQGGPLGSCQFRWPAGSALGLQACLALASVDAPPSPHRSAIDPQSLGHDMGLQALPEKLQGAESSLFEFGRAAMWSHTIPPHGILGHYLCRSQ